MTTMLLGACAPAASSPSPTPQPSSAPPTPTATLATPTSAVATPTALPPPSTGLVRYTNSELGFVLDLPAGWRRSVCSSGVTTTSPLAASEAFINVPENEEALAPGVRIVAVSVGDAQGLTPEARLQTIAPQFQIEKITLGGRPAARAFLAASGETYAVAVAARGWIYQADRTYFGTADPELRGIVETLRVLDDATLGRTPAPTSVPRTIEAVADALTDAFARKDLNAISDVLAPCVTSGGIPGDAVSLSRSAYLKLLTGELHGGTVVRVQARPIENDQFLGRFVRSTWSTPGQSDRRIDFALRATGERWSVWGVFVRAA